MSTPETPSLAKPPLVYRRDFIIAVILVILTMGVGFIGFKPDSTVNLIIAIVATVGISAGFCLRQAWALPAAMIVSGLGVLTALFGGILAASDAVTPSDAEKSAAWLHLIFGAFTIFWLKRDTVRASFPAPPRQPAKG